MWICVFVHINILTTSITPGVCCALNLPVFCSSLGCVTVLWPLLSVRCVFVQTVWMYRGWGRDYPPAEERAQREGAEADWYQTGGVKLRPPPWPDTRSHEPHAGTHAHAHLHIHADSLQSSITLYQFLVNSYTVFLCNVVTFRNLGKMLSCFFQKCLSCLSRIYLFK